MIFESKYRRQAMEKWDQEKEEILAEVKQDWIRFFEQVRLAKRRLKDAAAMLIHTSKKQT